MLSMGSWAEVHLYLACVFLGISTLISLNCLLAAPSYVVNYYKYASGNVDAKPKNRTLWANILSFYNVVSLVAQVICGPTVLTKTVRRLSLRMRVIISISLLMFTELLIILMPLGKVNQNTAAATLLVAGAIAGAGKAYLGSTNYAMVGPMPPKFMSAVMFGCGFSGLLSSVIQCITKASMGTGYKAVLTQSTIYFSVVLGILFVALLLALSLRYNSYVQQWVAEFSNTLNGSPNLEASISQSAKETVAAEPKDTNSLEMEQSRDVEEVVDPGEEEMLRNTAIIPVIKLIYPYMLSCFSVFFLSIFVLPGLIIPIDRDDEWFGTLAILAYNIGDPIGRGLTTLKVFWPRPIVLYVSVGCRLLFIPLLLLCVYGYIPGHTAPYIFVALIGLTNGFFGAISMIFGPSCDKLKTRGEKMMAGQLMGMSLLFGGTVAAFLALLITIYLP